MPTPADVAVVEGVMGLFDGRMGGEGFASTAHVAGLVQAPLVVVVDISRMARTTAALVHGLHTFEPGTRLSGVILNKAGSPRLVDEITAALEATGLPVLGVLPRDSGIEAPSRHLGLVPAGEREQAAATVRRLAEQVGEHVDLAAVLAIAHAAPPLDVEPWDPATEVHPPSAARPRVAVAAGRAFTFRYAETEELLRAAGCEPVEIDPLVDTALPEGTSGLYLGGGFPEVHATELSANAALRDVDRRRRRGRAADRRRVRGPALPLPQRRRRADGRRAGRRGRHDAEAHPALPGARRPRRRPARPGRHPGDRARVPPHDRHPGTRDGSAAWLAEGQAYGFSLDPAGLGRATLHASYQHVHWAGHPRLAQRFADAVHDHHARTGPSATSTTSRRTTSTTTATRTPREGLVDLAVNVSRPAPPDWLQRVVNASTATLGRYPQTDEAAKAIAAAHDVDLDRVLPTAGGAEAFTLVARAFAPRRAVVVHPQFTEPEAALLAAGHHPERLLLSRRRRLRPGPRRRCRRTPTWSWSATRRTRRASCTRPPTLRGAGPARAGSWSSTRRSWTRSPASPSSLVSADLPGVLVLRSLTKTWGLAGLRAGYVVGDPALVARLRGAAAAVVGLDAGAGRDGRLPDPERPGGGGGRGPALRGPAALPRSTPSPRSAWSARPRSRAPFVLLDSSRPASRPARPAGCALALRDQGCAVRRGETFPGLHADWLRVAVRDAETSTAFVAAVERCLA